MVKQRTRIGNMKQVAPHIVLTFEQLSFLQKTLAIIEKVALQTKPQPNLQLAQSTIHEMQAKINRLIEQGAWDRDIDLNYNSLLLLHASIWIFSLNLDMLPASPEKENDERMCQELALLFTPLLQKVHRPGSR